MATLRPSTWTVTVTFVPSEGSTETTSLEITVNEDSKDKVIEWLRENNADEGFLVVADVEGDVFSYRADAVRNVEIMRDAP